MFLLWHMVADKNKKKGAKAVQQYISCSAFQCGVIKPINVIIETVVILQKLSLQSLMLKIYFTYL